MAALATLEDLEFVMGSYPDDPSRATRLLEMASAAVRRWCGITFDHVVDDAITVQVTSGLLRLPNGPVTELTSISPVDGDAADLDGVTVDALGFVSGSWACTAYHVVYSHGYETIPDDVIEAVCNLVALRLHAGTPGVSAESLGDWSATYRDDPASAASGVMSALAPYRMAVGRIAAL